MPTSPVTVHGRSFEPPGKGGWELDSTHTVRPATHFAQEAVPPGFVRGFQEGTERYGLLLSHLQPTFVNSFMYMQPVPVGAPPGATSLPPKPVLQLMSRIHPEMRRRARTSERALADKRWREDLRYWDEVDKPAAIARHRDVQAVDVGSLSDEELAEHVALCSRHLTDNNYLHHKYTIQAALPVGDFVAGAQEWTGASVGEVLAVLRGQSAISRGVAAEELEAAGKAIATSDDARAVLAGDAPAEDVLAALSAHPDAGAAVSEYLEAVRWRCLGYDVGDRAAGEMPNALVESLRATVAGAAARPTDGSALEALRARVPSTHRDEFDDRLAEVRLMYRLRDERGNFGDGWAAGLARRALLEVGRRLAARGLLHDAEHAVDLTQGEAGALLLGRDGPSADEVADRFAWRTSVTTADAPDVLPVAPAPPPPPEWLPPRARRAAAAMNVFMESLFGVPQGVNDDTAMSGIAVNDGVYEGTARLVATTADFDRIRQGDVLVTRTTSPYFNVVLPMLGAIVTDRGGQLCHAAIVAREYGIPGIVGTRDATQRIPDGAWVRVDGGTGEVRVLG